MNMFMGGTTAAALVLSLASPQAGDPAISPPLALAQASPLNEVIVTAERRPELSGRTPVSVVAYDRRSVERQGLHNIDDVARLTPGIDFTRTGFGNVSRIAIRGLSSRIGAATTALYVDDTPMMVRTLGFTSINIYPSTFDLDRIEVLRGPQGTLFGAGAIGGAVRFITPEPGLDHWSGKVRGEVASVDHGEANYEAGAVLDGPLVQDKAGMRLTLWTRRDGGFVDHVDRNTGALRQKDSNRLETYLARLAFTLKPTEKLTISPRFYFQERRLRDNNLFWEAFSDPDAGRFANAAQVSQPDRDRGVLSMVKLGYDLGGAKLEADTSLFWRGETQRIDYSTFIPSSALRTPVVPGLKTYVAWSDMANKQNIFTQEVRLRSDSEGRLNWLIGGFYADNRQRARQLTIDPQGEALVRAATGFSFQQATGQPLIAGLYSYKSEETAYDRQFAGFGELRYEVLPKVTATAGLRVSSVRFRFVSDRAGGYAAGALFGEGSQKETPVTPRFALAYAPDEASLLYVSAAKGYRIGGGNAPVPSRCAADLAALGLSAAPADYDSDSVWSYEAGAKAGLFHGRLHLESSVFHIDWRDVQQSVALPACGQSYVANAGRAKSDGFDLQAEGDFGPLSLTLSVGYADARFRDTVLGGVADAAGRRAVIVSAGDSLGNRPWSAAFAAEYSFKGPLGAPAYVRLDYQHLGADGRRSPVQDPLTYSYDPGLPNPSAANQLGLRAGLRFEEVELTLFAENVTNATPRLTRTHDTVYSGFFAQNTFRPRTIGVSANYAF